MNYGSALRQLRDQNNLTQKQMGDAIGKSNSLIAQFESNKKPISDDILTTLTEMYDFSRLYFETLAESIPDEVKSTPEITAIIQPLSIDGIENYNEKQAKILDNSFLGDIFKEERLLHGKELDEAAKEMYLFPEALRKLEDNIVFPHRNIADQLGKHYNIPADTITSFYNNIGTRLIDRLRGIGKQAHMPLDKLVKGLNISLATLYNIRSNKVQLTPEKLYDVAKYFNVSWHDLLDPSISDRKIFLAWQGDIDDKAKSKAEESTPPKKTEESIEAPPVHAVVEEAPKPAPGIEAKSAPAGLLSRAFAALSDEEKEIRLLRLEEFETLRKIQNLFLNPYMDEQSKEDFLKRIIKSAESNMGV